MVINRRIPEALSLRTLFQAQWEHIETLLNQWQQRREKERQEEKQLASAVEYLVDHTSQRLRCLTTYQGELRSSTRELLEFIEGLVEDIPQPIPLDRETLIADPVARTLFKSRRFADELFENSPDFREFIHQQLDTPEKILALIHLFKHEKRILGSAIQGNMIVRDVLQTMVNFSGHRIVLLRGQEPELRSGIKRLLFDNVAEHIRMEMTRILRQRQEELRTRKVVDPEQCINNPVVYLRHVREMLSSPKNLIRVQEQQITIDKMGIKFVELEDMEPMSSTDTLDFRELAIGKEDSRILCMVSYPIRQQPTVER